MSTITAEELLEIVALTNSVPEEYRQKCFELLLGYELDMKRINTTAVPVAPPGTEPPTIPPVHRVLILPIDVRAFLGQYGMDESVVWKYFLKEGEEIRPIYQLKVTKKAKAQIQHALMLALESAIITGQFRVDIEALRSRCIEHKCYDASNFIRNIQNSSKLFKSTATDQPLSLSPDGKTELAEILEQL